MYIPGLFTRITCAFVDIFIGLTLLFTEIEKEKMEANVPRKKSRLAKNKKKAWRKVDITDVEEFLEDERLQERTGYDFM